MASCQKDTPLSSIRRDTIRSLLTFEDSKQPGVHINLKGVCPVDDGLPAMYAASEEEINSPGNGVVSICQRAQEIGEARGRIVMAIKLVAPTQPRLLTVQEWIELPDADQYELIDGVLRLRMVNQNYHEFAVIRLGQILANYLDRTGVAGSVFGSNTKYRVRARRDIMPDLSAVLGAKADAIDPDAAYNTVGPDLAIEVLSPDQDDDYIEERLGDYWKLGTAEVWFVNSKLEAVTGYGREAHEFAVFAVARHDEEFSSRLLAGLTFSVKPLWMRRSGARPSS